MAGRSNEPSTLREVTRLYLLCSSHSVASCPQACSFLGTWRHILMTQPPHRPPWLGNAPAASQLYIYFLLLFISHTEHEWHFNLQNPWARVALVVFGGILDCLSIKKSSSDNKRRSRHNSHGAAFWANVTFKA